MIVRVTINVEALRADLLDKCDSAFYGGGIGSALLMRTDVERASAQELANMAEDWGIDVRNYIVDDEEEEEEEEEETFDPYSW